MALRIRQIGLDATPSTQLSLETLRPSAPAGDLGRGH